MASAQTCVRCADNFIVNNKSITCKLCSNRYHLQCVQLKDVLGKVLSESSNLMWFCDTCVTIVEDKLKQTSTVENIEESVKQIMENTKTLLNIVTQSSVSTNEVKKSWADVVQSHKPQPLVIKPKNGDQNSSLTKTALEEKLNPADMAISVHKIKATSQGGIAIQCNDKTSMEKLQNIAKTKLADNYSISVPKGFTPKIVIIGVPGTVVDNVDEFVNKILKQNCNSDCIQTHVRFNHKYVPRNKKNFNVVIEVDISSFRDFIERGRIFVGWQSYRTEEYVHVLRCFKCWRYGHRASVCERSNDTCPLCNQSHKSSECKSSSLECTNCKHAAEVLKIPNIEYNHTVFDKNCKSYKRALELVKSRINYAL